MAQIAKLFNVPAILMLTVALVFSGGLVGCADSGDDAAPAETATDPGDAGSDGEPEGEAGSDGGEEGGTGSDGGEEAGSGE